MTQIKEGLLAEMDRRVADQILEPTNAELLKKLIRQADSDNEAMMIAELGTTYKRTGLHFDKRLERMTDDIHYFRRNKELSFHTDDNKPTHKLIIGDNYQAMQNLLIEYRGRVDVIYIDPPYGKDSMGEFAQTNYENAITRDNLLSMLYPRLMLAKMLLSDSGVIFCSIDDKNQAYVKCLFDEVFGENKYIETFSWVKTSTPANLSKKTKKSVEYILCYSNLDKSVKFKGLSKESSSNNGLMNHTNSVHTLFFPANKVDTKMDDGIYKKGRYGTKSYEITLEEDTEVKDGYFIKPVKLTGRFKWSQNNLDKEIENGPRISIKTNAFSPSYDKVEYDPEVPWYIIDKECGVDTNEVATTEVESILGAKKFDHPKPMTLVSYLLGFTENNIVLDFFAGSGTTGHAVLELNRSERQESDLMNEGKPEGNRTFILCQLNEKTDTTPNGIAYDVTAKRLKRIMTGECYDGTKDFDWLKKNKPYGGNLDVYEIDTVANFKAIEGETPFDVIDETLYGLPPFDTLRDKVEWVCSNFQQTQKTV